MKEDKWSKKLKEMVEEKLGEDYKNKTIEDSILGSSGTKLMAKEHGKFWAGVAMMLTELVLESASDDDVDPVDILQNMTAAIGALWCVAYQEAIKTHGKKQTQLKA